MKLVTFRTADRSTHAGVMRGESIITLDYPGVLDLLRDPEGLSRLRNALAAADKENILASPEPIAEAVLPDPTRSRDDLPASLSAGCGDGPVRCPDGAGRIKRDAREPRSLQHAPHERHRPQRDDERQARVRHHDPDGRSVAGCGMHPSVNP